MFHQDSSLSGKDIGTIIDPQQRVENKYMSRRIYSQKFKDNIMLHKINSEHLSKNEFETPDISSKNVCKCK